jgi:hypothetical protein
VSDSENYSCAREVLIIDSREVGKWWQHMKPSPFDHLRTMGQRDRANTEEQRPAMPPITMLFDGMR